MDRIEFVHGDDFAEQDGLRDPGLLDVAGVSGDLGGACYPSGYEVADEAEEQDTSERPPKGTFLDETILLREPEGSALVSAVIGRFDERRSRLRKAHQSEIENERNLVRCILANGLRCYWYRSSPVVAYKRMAAGYSEKSHRPTWLSGRALQRSVELLAEAGLATSRVGRRWTASSYVLTEALLTLAAEHGIAEHSLVLTLHREDLVRLKGEKPRPYWDRRMGRLVRPKAPRIYFAPIPATEAWRDMLSAYNSFVAAQKIAVGVSSSMMARWIDHLNQDEEHSGASFVRPELFRTSVYRVFNDGAAEHPSFDKGGRLVGAWWVNAPEEVRARITINEEPTVELDYRACHPRMLYHERGLEAPEEPYSTPEIVNYEREAGLPLGHLRAAEKWLTQVLINGRGRPDLASRPEEINLTPGMARAFAEAIKRHHAPIASAFGSGAGVQLMKTESEIAFGIITRAMAEGWTALSVHDSFIAPHSAEKRLRQLMEEEYIDKLGGQPKIH
jgi:hypothetical protein